MTTDSDARPGTEGAGETADVLLGQIRAQVCCCEDAAEIDVPEQVAAERAEMDRLLEAYRDACKGEARAALLRDAPVVYVATDRGVDISQLSPGRWEMHDGVAFANEDSEAMTMWGHPPLTPPGTVRRAYLVIPEGEETPT